MALTLHIGLNSLRSTAQTWGDLGFAHSLCTAFQALGHRSALFFRDEVPQMTGQGDVVLRIIGPHLDEPVPGVPNLLWVISPPNQAFAASLARYQALFFASAPLAARCRALGLNARYLPQATDTDLFTPYARGDLPVDLQISFVGNHAPRAPRATVVRAIALGFDVRIWGQGWDGFVPTRHLQGTRLDTAQTAQVYARSRVVLNSHMPSMAEAGFMSNRSFDALACGAQVVSDPVPGFADPGLAGLHQTDADQGLSEALAQALSAGQGAQDRAMRAALVRDRYSFAARARTLAAEAAALLAQQICARDAFAVLPARATRGDLVALTLSDAPDHADEAMGSLADHLDARMAGARVDVTLVLSDPTTTPDGLNVEQVMQRAAMAVWRIGAVMARAASFARLRVVPPAGLACQGPIHALMPDHRAAQAAACGDLGPEAIATLDRVCARVRRVLECPVGALSAQSPEEHWLDPVQARIRLLTNRPLYPHTPAGFSRDRQKRHLRLWPRSTLAQTGAPIGVFVHLFHADLAPVFRERLAVLDLTHRLYVSTDTQAKAVRILAHLPQAEVRVLPNRGRDVFAKLYGFADAHAAHDIILHLHGKKSPHAQALDQWLDHCLTCLLPSRDEVLRIVSLFQTIPDLGIVAPLTFRSVLAAAHWGDNLEIARELALRMRLDRPLPPDAELDFPVGSMFWARRRAVQPLLDLALTPAHFPPEAGQVDATPAHAIERLFGVVCQVQGHRLIRVAPAHSHQHKAQQINARRNEDVRRALQDGDFGP